METLKGAALAAAVASMLSAAGCASGEPSAVGQTDEALRCVGGNECKGMSECAGGDGKNMCMGMNECAGMGWTSVDSAEECEELGGEIAS